METWDAILSRRNVRRFEDRPIPDESLDRILEAGRRAPSSQNRQRWDFVVCTDRDQLVALSEVWRGAGHVAGSAATICLLAPDADDPAERESIRSIRPGPGHDGDDADGGGPRNRIGSRLGS